LTQTIVEAKCYQVGTMKVEVHPDSHAAVATAAEAAAKVFIKLAHTHNPLGADFAAGASQFETLNELARIPNLPGEQVIDFDMDEYVNLAADYPGSFRRYLRERLTALIRTHPNVNIDFGLESANELGGALPSQ
jgi:glucosamine-6-phosphate deaminase